MTIDLDAIRERAVAISTEEIAGARYYGGLIQQLAESADDVPALLSHIERLEAVLAKGVDYFRGHAADNETGRWWLSQIERVFAPVAEEVSPRV